MNKSFSLAAHLIHSRLQMVKHRMRIARGVQIPNIVWNYKRVFERAAAAVFVEHGVECEYKDSCFAAEMLYNSFYPPPSKSAQRYFIIEYDNCEGTVFAVGSLDENGKPIPADPIERLTDDEAHRRYNSFSKGRSSVYRIVERYWEPEL